MRLAWQAARDAYTRTPFRIGMPSRLSDDSRLGEGTHGPFIDSIAEPPDRGIARRPRPGSACWGQPGGGGPVRSGSVRWRLRLNRAGVDDRWHGYTCESNTDRPTPCAGCSASAAICVELRRTTEAFGRTRADCFGLQNSPCRALDGLLTV